jgi:hypothetical protein
VTDPHLLVPSRFCGPPSSGNGGWTSGALAALVPQAPDDHARGWPPLEVALRMPPPLDTPMPVAEADGWLEATHEGATVARVRPADHEPVPVGPVSAEEAEIARDRYPGLRSHPFPTCFTCGTGRDEGDGLRIFPGRVADSSTGATRAASTWTPDDSLREDDHQDEDDTPRVSLATTWAALDCVGGWAGDLEERLMVLARMVTKVDRLPRIGERHVVVGEARGRDGRKTSTAASLYDAGGRPVGTAEHLWIAVDPADFS